MSLAVIWLAGSAAALAPTPVIAPDSSAVAPQQVRATRLVRPIVIDGVLHDGMWEGAERVTRSEERRVGGSGEGGGWAMERGIARRGGSEEEAGMGDLCDER